MTNCNETNCAQCEKTFQPKRGRSKETCVDCTRALRAARDTIQQELDRAERMSATLHRIATGFDKHGMRYRYDAFGYATAY